MTTAAGPAPPPDRPPRQRWAPGWRWLPRRPARMLRRQRQRCPGTGVDMTAEGGRVGAGSVHGVGRLAGTARTAGPGRFRARITARRRDHGIWPVARCTRGRSGPRHRPEAARGSVSSGVMRRQVIPPPVPARVPAWVPPRVPGGRGGVRRPGIVRAGVPEVGTGCRLNGVAFGFGHADALETGYVVLVPGPGARYLRLRLAIRALLTGRGGYQVREGTVAGRRTFGCHPASSSISGSGSARQGKSNPRASASRAS